ncbi:Serine proteinase stubble [Papilio machaon]|uniref:Phenoloxidase-activating factor 2 n=1 Tax=Papilio machaon TaxID=76193 RepID=A0A194RG88_PAPMA|nr:Serine proteinase stubble [Papilio machaon]
MSRSSYKIGQRASLRWLKYKALPPEWWQSFGRKQSVGEVIMRLSLSSCLLLSITIAVVAAEWSWGNEKNTEAEEQKEKSTELLEGEHLTVAQDKSLETNETVLDGIVDELINGKQGRSLGGFDEVYGDPTIKEALDSGDDTEARNLIKDRLCTLGLIQCEEGETQEKRTYVSPDDLIYAQPVDIKPIGKPVASIPIRGPPRAYGPPKPMPYPSRPQKLPPKRIGYGGNIRPGFSDKYGLSGSNYQFSQNSGVYNAHESNFVTKPPIYANEGPYAFENSKPTYNKIPANVQTGVKTDIVQQHVHHHYVHSDAEKDPKVIIKPVAIPVGSVGHLGSQNFAHESSDVITASGGDYSSITSGGFKPMTGNYPLYTKPVYESDTVYGSQYGHTNVNKGSANIASQSLPNQYANNVFDDQKYSNSLGNYASQNTEFYKKELHVGSANNLYNQGPATFGQSNQQNYQQSYHEPKAQGFDCVCVNYDQCPSQEIIGRRDDLYLPIDPRNKGSEIAALTEEQLDNLNATVASDLEVDAQQNQTTVKSISKREAATDKQDDADKEAEPRVFGLAGNGGNGGNNNKQVQPTFGVSFGLPQPSHGGYPINPFNANPIYNPYGPALNGGGINLGLLSVNPLLAVQVTKNDYGEKIVKPFVNLHVTPNEHVVNKIGDLFHEKKLYLLNKHEHYHHHNPYDIYHNKPYVHAHNEFAPHHNYPPPIYSPHSPHYGGYYRTSPYNSPEPQVDNEDYYDDDNTNLNNDHIDYNYQNNGFYNPNFERSANVTADNQNSYANRYAYSRSLTVPSHRPGANRGGQSIRFPENRRKREVSLDKSIEERQGYFGRPSPQRCQQNQVCCRRPLRPQASNRGQCGIRHSQGINGRIKTPSYIDGDSEFGEYPWQAAILKKDPKESVYVCGGTLIDGLHIMTAAHCVKSYKGFELRVRLGEWDVNHDVEFYPYIERDVVSVHVHPTYYAGTLDNDLAILKLEHPVDWTKYPHISPACLPDKYTEYAGQRCWTTGWGKDAFGDYGKYQNILKEVDVPILAHGQCQQQLKQTRLGYNYELNPGFICAGGEEGKDACKGDGGGPLVCERSGTWQLVGVVSWGIGCGQPGVPGVYVKVAHYLDWISQVTGKFSNY